MSVSKKWYSLDLGSNKKKESSGSCGCGKAQGSCNSQKEELSADEFYEAAINASIGEERHRDGFEQVFDVKMDRRTAFRKLTASLLIGAGAVSTSCSVIVDDETKEKAQIEEQRIKEWEIKFDENRKKRDEEQFLMEERLKEKEEERRKKLELSKSDKPN